MVQILCYTIYAFRLFLYPAISQMVKTFFFHAHFQRVYVQRHHYEREYINDSHLRYFLFILVMCVHYPNLKLQVTRDKNALTHNGISYQIRTLTRAVKEGRNEKSTLCSRISLAPTVLTRFISPHRPTPKHRIYIEDVMIFFKSRPKCAGNAKEVQKNEERSVLETYTRGSHKLPSNRFREIAFAHTREYTRYMKNGDPT